jgi:hypothetical protein
MQIGTPIDEYNFKLVNMYNLFENSVRVNGRENTFLIQKGPNQKQRAQILYDIDRKFEYIIKQLKPNEYIGSEQKMIYILKNTPHIFVELTNKTGFLGVNYPLGVKKTTSVSFGTDKKERAMGRVVFLTIDPKYISKKRLEDLIIHELSHTLANHVRYRPDDHGKDFIAAENLFKKIWTTYK